MLARRNPGDEDYAAIVGALDTWWGERRMSGMLPRFFIRHFGNTSHVVYDDDQLLAFLVGFVSPTLPTSAYIHFVGVHPDHRTQGHARALYQEFFVDVANQGCTVVEAVTNPVNTGSIAFHRRMGFDIVAGDSPDQLFVTDYDGADQPRVVFRRDLSLLSSGSNA